MTMRSLDEGQALAGQMPEDQIEDQALVEPPLVEPPLVEQVSRSQPFGPDESQGCQLRLVR